QVTVLFAGQHIAKSPFEVTVGKSLGDAGRVTAQGPGLEPTGNIANKLTSFEIFTAGTGAGEVEVEGGPGGEAGLGLTPPFPPRGSMDAGGGRVELGGGTPQAGLTPPFPPRQT
ncbi:filamin, alpha, partial [Chelydra serpentina]